MAMAAANIHDDYSARNIPREPYNTKNKNGLTYFYKNGRVRSECVSATVLGFSYVLLYSSIWVYI